MQKKISMSAISNKSWPMNLKLRPSIEKFRPSLSLKKSRRTMPDFVQFSLGSSDNIGIARVLRLKT